MAIQFREAASGINSYSGAEIDVPATVQPGDLLIAAVEVNSLANTLTGPTGWTVLDTSAGSNTGGSQFTTWFSRRATADDANQTVVFPVNPAGSTKTAVMAAYYTDTTGALVTVGVSSWRGETTDTTMHANPVINVAQLPAWLITAVGKKGSTVTTLTPPTNYTARATDYRGGTSNIGVAIADRAASVTGNTSGMPWTTNVANKAATTLLLSLYETEPPPPPTMALRRWDGTGWVLASG